MSNEVFGILICVGLIVSFGFYTAGLWISFKSRSRYAVMPPMPPIPMELVTPGGWPAVRVKLHRDMEFVLADKRKLRVIMSAIDVAYAQGMRDQKAKENKA